MIGRKKLFITGASGFVGQNFIRHVQLNYDVAAFDRIHIDTTADAFLHFAGKAHDVMSVATPDEYYIVNTELTKRVFDAFLGSGAQTFIFLSSVKAAADSVLEILDESITAKPLTHYGKSKLKAEQYILAQYVPAGKKVYILRPGMIHGPGNKGNLNLLYKLVHKGIPWPLGAFENKRSFCSINNLLFVLQELIERNNIPSGVYNVVDDVPLSTNEIIMLMNEALGKRNPIWHIPKPLVMGLAKAGNVLHLPLNSERLKKLTENYVVSNKKLKTALGKLLPVSSASGMLHTLQSFKDDVE